MAERKVGQEEYERLLKQHQSDLIVLESNLDKEKERQQNSLEQKVM